MADGVTYAGALAACVARWGAPTFDVRAGGDEHDRWPAETDWCLPPTGRSVAQVAVSDRGDRVTLSAWLHMSDEPMREWTLAGEPTADAPLTPLLDALDAADRWLRERNAPTKGP